MIYIYDSSLEMAFIRAGKMTGHYVDSANKRFRNGKHIGYTLGLIRYDKSSNTNHYSDKNVKGGVV